MKKWCTALISLLGVLCFFTGCETVPGTDRSALRLMPESTLESMAAASFQQMQQEVPVSTNRTYNQKVRRVGNRIAEVVRHELPNTQWEFVVFDDDAINAFAMPGGKVGVYTGMFRIAKTDDDLAVVMGHEIAHVVARHGNERVSQQMLAAGIGMGLLLGTRNMDQTDRQLIMAAYGAGSSVGFLLPYSRHHESEADELGLMYSARAGYNPEAAIGFWQRMEAESQHSIPEFLSTHPSGDTRIRRLQAIMPQARAEYERAIQSGR